MVTRGCPGGAVVKNPPAKCRRGKRHRFNPQVRKIPWSRKWQLTPVFLPEKFHGQRSLAGYSPWGSQRVRHIWVTEHTHRREQKNGMSQQGGFSQHFPSLRGFSCNSLSITSSLTAPWITPQDATCVEEVLSEGRLGFCARLMDLHRPGRL